MERTAGQEVKQDAVVRIADDDGPLTIEVESTVQGLFGRAVRRAAEEELARLTVTTGTVRIEDRQALDFVIRARLRAAVKALREAGGLI